MRRRPPPSRCSEPMTFALGPRAAKRDTASRSMTAGFDQQRGAAAGARRRTGAALGRRRGTDSRSRPPGQGMGFGAGQSRGEPAAHGHGVARGRRDARLRRRPCVCETVRDACAGRRIRRSNGRMTCSRMEARSPGFCWNRKAGRMRSRSSSVSASILLRAPEGLTFPATSSCKLGHLSGRGRLRALERLLRPMIENLARWSGLHRYPATLARAGRRAWASHFDPHRQTVENGIFETLDEQGRLILRMRGRQPWTRSAQATSISASRKRGARSGDSA